MLVGMDFVPLNRSIVIGVPYSRLVARRTSDLTTFLVIFWIAKSILTQLKRSPQFCHRLNVERLAFLSIID